MFKIYQATTLEKLAEKFRTCAFGNRKPGLDLTPVTVINQTRGIADWLRVNMAKSGDNGLSMNLDMLLPNQFVRKTVDRIFRPDINIMLDANSIRWRIFRELAENSTAYPELDSFLNNICSNVQDLAGDGLLKAWQLSRKTDDLFDNYQLTCQQLIRRWRSVASPDELQNSSERWLCRIFRNCFRDETCCYEEYLHKFIEDDTIIPQAIEGWQGGTVHIFGVGAMRNAWFRFFHELGKRNFYDVNFFYLAPSKEYFADQFSRRESRKFSEEEIFGNVIFQNNCRQGRLFFQTLLDELDENEFDYQGAEEDDTEECSALARLQYEISSLSDKNEMPTQEFIPDGTIAFHDCHSMRRQVEVLHDHLLMEFDRDPSLLPSDILVMAPDIDAFAPYIHSVFSEHPNLAWRISICDRAMLSSVSVLNSFIDILHCTMGICTAEEVLSLLEHPAVQRRYGIEHAQLPEIREWVRNAGIRWGSDTEHHKMQVDCDFREFSWKYGLQRLMMGIVRTSSRLPDDDGICQLETFSGNHDLLFAFSAFVNDFLELRQQVVHSHTFSEWKEILLKAADTFLPAIDEDSEMQEESSVLRHAINQLTQCAIDSGIATRTPLQLITAMLQEHFSSPGSAHNFISDKMTFCAMRPMRSIPKRIIAILGMNENAFPKRPVNPAFDLSKPLHSLDNLPKPQDNYTSSDEDRYMFLETILAAREKLWFFYNGRKSFNEDKLQCAAPLAELIDYLKAEKHIIMHDRHAFSSRYFRQSGTSVNRRAFNIASKLQHRQPAENADICRTFPEVQFPDEVTLQEIQSWLEDPCTAFVNKHYSLNYSIKCSDELPNQEIGSEQIDYPIAMDIAKEILVAPSEDREEYLCRTLGGKCLLPPTDYLRRKVLDTFSEVTADEYYRNAASLPMEVRISLPIASGNDEDEETRDIIIRHRMPHFVAPDGTRHFFQLIFSSPNNWKSCLREHLSLAFIRAALSAEESAVLHILQWNNSERTMTDIGPEQPVTGGMPGKLTDIVGIYWEGLMNPLPIFPKTAAVAIQQINDEDIDREKLAEEFSDTPYGEHSRGDWCNPAVAACGYTTENIDAQLDDMLELIRKILQP